jgi:hypothetical protein
MTTYTTYKFDEFEYIDGILKIPSDTVFFRGIRDIDEISEFKVLRKDIPIYLTNYKNALEKYAKIKENLFIISNKLELKLMDIRKVISIMQYLINNNNSSSTDEDINTGLKYLSISLGLVDLNTQIKYIVDIVNKEGIDDTLFIHSIKELIKYNEKSPTYFPFLNKPGVRIGITDIDGLSIIIIKDIFSDYCDGIIAPRLFSPLQPDNHLHEEIILFDTNKLKEIKDNINIKTLDIKNIILDKLINFKSKNYKLEKQFYMHAGFKEYSEDKNRFFENKIKIKEAKKISNKLIKHFRIKKNKQIKINQDLDPELESSCKISFKNNIYK